MIAAIQRQEESLRAEHAVYGLDALAEVEFHPLFAATLGEAGFGVLREVAYPHEWSRKLKPDSPKLPEFRDRQRCDLVLTERPGQKLSDALLAEKKRRANKKALENSLFADVAVESEPSEPELVPPEEAFWLEIKLVGQYCYSAGVPGPNRSYSSELTRNMIGDLAKLAADEHIATAALGIVLFTDTVDTAKHDLMALVHKLLDKELPVSSPVTRTIGIQERIGNSVCTVAVIAFRK